MGVKCTCFLFTATGSPRGGSCR